MFVLRSRQSQFNGLPRISQSWHVHVHALENAFGKKCYCNFMFYSNINIWREKKVASEEETETENQLRHRNQCSTARQEFDILPFFQSQFK